MSSQVLRDQSLTNEASTITAQLRELHDRLGQNEQLAKLVPFSIKPRNQRDLDSLDRFSSYTGPDLETLNILKTKKYHWSENGQQSIDDIAFALWLLSVPVVSGYTIQCAKTELNAMIGLGSRYRNIDQHLGYGASLVLGTVFPETMWTKTLRKSGTHFNNVMGVLRQAGITQLAEEMRPAFKKVMDYEMLHLEKLVAEHTVPVEQNDAFDTTVEFEDPCHFPLDPSFGEIGIDVSLL